MKAANPDLGEVAMISPEWDTTMNANDPENGDVALSAPGRTAPFDSHDPEISEGTMASPDWHTTIRGDHSEVVGFAGESADSNTTTKSSYESIKPWLDRPLAVILLLISAPIIVLSAILTKLNSRGSWIYAQKRLGQNGQIFTIYKIRTMYEDSERHSGATWSLPGDPRVTPVGRVLRLCHLDELPQLVNVLKGEMSLVGPRPERPEFLGQLEQALPHYRQRLAVRPGLTGLAQVQQPPDSDIGSVRCKLNYDLCYVDRMSLWLDLRLLVGTALKCLGVPFVLIGQFLQLPDPNHDRGHGSFFPKYTSD
jgi:lipopolysaccharide/colanic/teichoic acid biosynthesis glycosyltransferase